MITEDYVSFETSKLLKEKGFDENTSVNYFVGDDKPRGCVVGEMIHHKKLPEDTHLIAAPTLQMTMKWLREVHKLPINVWYDKEEDTLDDKVWRSEAAVNKPSYILVGSFSTYEQACEEAIKYCLENLI